MRKQKKRFFQKGLCGILSAAMILTSAVMPGMSAYAAQPAVTDTIDGESGTDPQPGGAETPSQDVNFGNTGTENPDAEVSADDHDADKAGAADGEHPDSPAGDGADSGDQPGENGAAADAGTDLRDAADGDAAKDDTAADGTKSNPGGSAKAATAAEAGGSDGTASVTFYYYAGDTGDEIGLYYWDDSEEKSNIASTAGRADWHVQAAGDTYLMTAVEGYAGWYSIPITFRNSGDSAGFQVYTKTAATSEDPELKKPEYRCGSGDSGDNSEVYSELVSGKNGTGAVKNQIAYIGSDAATGLDKVTAVMRNITLHVYSEAVMPAFQLDNASAASSLSVVNEEDGSLSDITPSGRDSSNNNVYEMQKMADDENWYTLSFSVPAVREAGSKICGFFEKKSDGSYLWLKDLVDGPTADAWAADFTPVFAGNVYCKYEDGSLSFYRSKEEAETITLAMLRGLVESEECQTITAKGANGYTEASWTAFQTAKTNAETVVKDNSAQDDSCTSEEIRNAYTALKEAMGNMEAGGDGTVVTLYYYSEELNQYTDSDTETYHLYMSTWNKDKIASDKEAVELSQGAWSYTAFLFDKVTDEAVNMGYDNWYCVPVRVIAANDGADGDGFIIQIGKKVTAGAKETHTALESDMALIKLSYWENASIYSEIASMENGGSIAIKNGKAFESIQKAEETAQITIGKLQELVDEAKKLKEEDYKRGWKDFTDALAEAEAVLKAEADSEADGTKEAPTDEQIREAYDKLLKAMEALVPKSAPDAEINVQKVALTDDFITGADISSYIALKDSGVVFKDENGKPLNDAEFFNYLHDGGMNWVRIRIWNDPYDSSGNGYGGGNNDLEKAIRIGKLATNANMRVLIDFHYSDFWADPKKQKAPKAWAGYDIAQKEKAVYDFTLDSLTALKNASVDVGMVQVGNETNNGICGETAWDNMAALFNAGSRAVRAFDQDCLVAVHFTDPQKGYGAIASRLNASEVDYDVFASSFYPFGHGDTANLKAELTEIVKKYGKKVMAAETSWPTTLVDGDGYGNATPPTVPVSYESQNYGVSVQGQADEMRDLVNAVNEINDAYAGSSLGVFYWEPAWISPYYIKDEEGNDIDSLYKQNFDLWEKHGSGWASSYAAEYDPDDAGVWFGGSAMDNSSWFDFDGTALPTAKIYSLIRTGATAELKIASVDSRPVLKVPLGDEILWADVTAAAKYNNGTETQLNVIWDEDEKELVNTYKAGEYIVHGIASAEGNDIKITLTVRVLRAEANNILENPDFENNSKEPWIIEKKVGSAGENDVVRVTNEDPHGGMKGLHFWSEIGLDFTVSQKVSPEAGTYMFGGYIQGGGADREDVQYAFARVVDQAGRQKSYFKAPFALQGWKEWSNPEIAGIVVEEGDSIEVGLLMKSSVDGAWGTMDDFYLYGTHSISVADGITHGSVAANVLTADSGEKVIVTAAPDSGYWLDTLTIAGASVTEQTLTSVNGEVVLQPASDENTLPKAVLTYKAETAEEKSETFTMPNGNVEVSATFKSVFDETAGKISLDAQDDSDKYIVQVNVGESDAPDGENPIADQFYTGKNVTPSVELSYKGYKLTSADYTVEYKNNKNKTTPDSRAKLILTAKGDKFAGTREILFAIVEDNREDFTKLKVTFKSPDKGDGTTPAKSIYYLGRQKEITPEIILKNASGGVIANPADKPVYKVYYQNNKKLGKATLVVLPTDEGLKTYKEGSVTATFTIAKCPVNQDQSIVEVTVASSPNYYTGKKVVPSVTVKYHYTEQSGESKTVTLTKGTDYTVTYTNNVNASVYDSGEKDEQGNPVYKNINDKKVPAIKITGKGNFAGVRTTVDIKDGKPGDQKLTFPIYPKALKNTVVTVDDLAEKTGAQAPKLTVKDGAKTVAASQYVIEEIVRTQDADGNAVSAEAGSIYSRAKGTGTAKVKDAGTYEITVAGKQKSNYEGIKSAGNAGFNDKLTFRVVDKDHLMANARITISGKFYYTGNGITLSSKGSQPNLTVKAGTAAEPLTEFASFGASKDKDGVEQDGYYVTYSNNVNAGKAVVTINGTGKYIGTKTAAFTINKRTLAKEVSGADQNKKGEVQTPKLSAKVVKDKLDGELLPDAQGALINSDNGQKSFLKVPYTGYTINPDFKFSSINCDPALAGETKQPAKELAAGDYTVSYKVGAWAEGKAPVTVIIKGKGNYSGSVKFESLFTLTERELDKLSIEVAPVTYNGKALKPAVTFYNENGKAVDLKLNTAYTVSYKNNKDSRAVNRDPDRQPTVTVKVKGKGWKTSGDPATRAWKKEFTIGQAEITRADVGDVVFQTFLGKALKPKVTIKVNGRKLKEGKDYTLTYSRNVNRGGTATVTVTGKGNYFTRKPIEKSFVIK